jgi:hypothetical protein
MKNLRIILALPFVGMSIILILLAEAIAGKQ